MGTIPQYQNRQVRAAPIPSARATTYADPDAFGASIGKVVQGIAADEMRRADLAAINKASAEYERSWTDALYGEDGLTLKSGEALFEAEGPAVERQRARQAEILEGLNPRQRAVAEQELFRVTERNAARLSGHVGTQRKRYEQAQFAFQQSAILEGMVKSAPSIGWAADGSLDITGIEGSLEDARRSVRAYAQAHPGWLDGLTEAQYVQQEDDALRQEYLPRVLDAILATGDDQRAAAFLEQYGGQLAPRDQKTYGRAVGGMSTVNSASRAVALALQESPPDITSEDAPTLPDQKRAYLESLTAGLEPGSEEYEARLKFGRAGWAQAVEDRENEGDAVKMRFGSRIDSAVEAAQGRADVLLSPQRLRYLVDAEMDRIESMPDYGRMTPEQRDTLSLYAEEVKGHIDERAKSQRGVALIELTQTGDFIDQLAIRRKLSDPLERQLIPKETHALLTDYIKGIDEGIPSTAATIKEAIDTFGYEGPQALQFWAAAHQQAMALKAEGGTMTFPEAIEMIARLQKDAPLGPGKVFELTPSDVTIDEVPPNIKTEIIASLVGPGKTYAQVTDAEITARYWQGITRGVYEPNGLDIDDIPEEALGEDFVRAQAQAAVGGLLGSLSPAQAAVPALAAPFVPPADPGEAMARGVAALGDEGRRELLRVVAPALGATDQNLPEPLASAFDTGGLTAADANDMLAKLQADRVRFSDAAAGKPRSAAAERLRAIDEAIAFLRRIQIRVQDETLPGVVGYVPGGPE